MSKKEMKREVWSYNYISGIIVIMTFFSFLILIASLASESNYSASESPYSLSPKNYFGKSDSLSGDSLGTADVKDSGNNLRGGFTCNVADWLPSTFAGCYGDADGNGVVNPGDRGFIAANIGQTSNELICLYDLDGNGIINPSDRASVSANIGLCTPLPDYQNGSGLNGGVPDTRFGGGETNNPFCEDSDGGINFYFAGSITFLEESDVTATLFDYCDTQNRVHEEYCFNDIHQEYISSCVAIGASQCVTSAQGVGTCVGQPQTCSDTDGGFVPNVAGRVSGTGANGQSYSVKEVCGTGNSLYEAYCDVNGRVAIERVNCPSGCTQTQDGSRCN